MKAIRKSRFEYPKKNPRRARIYSLPVHLLTLVFFLSGIWSFTATSSAADAGHRKTWDKRWVYLNMNMLVEGNAKKAHKIMERAAAVGFNGIVLADSKTSTWFHPDFHMPSWERNVKSLRNHARQLDLEFQVHVMPFGSANGILSHDVNLATGYPIKAAKLRAEGGKLIPVGSAAFRNASFEDHDGDRFSGWFNDDPGKGSFIDRKTVKHGSASIRFEGTKDANEHGHARVNQTVRVEPFHQYRVRVWMKCEDLSGWFAVMAKARDGTRDLQTLSNSPSHLTADWTEYVMTFNSVASEEVIIYAGIWGGKGGRFWLDRFTIEEVPTLNVLRRESLPLKITTIDGRPYEQGRDFKPVVDPKLGRNRWKGNFGNRHSPPSIELTADSRIRDGQIVLLSCYHALLMPQDQVTCSMVEPKVYDICAEQVRQLRAMLDPDGYYLGHDKIRTGGWEPQATHRFKTSGELFAWNIERCYEIANSAGGGKPVSVWSDMFDPHHNARADYYMVNNTIAGSSAGLHPELILISWGTQREGVEFFAGLGNRQIVAGYYDGDVEQNYNQWMQATQGINGVVGTIYCTWSGQWDDLERYAEVWWGGTEKNSGGPVEQEETYP